LFEQGRVGLWKRGPTVQRRPFSAVSVHGQERNRPLLSNVPFLMSMS
jgi:hypothetical protein